MVGTVFLFMISFVYIMLHPLTPKKNRHETVIAYSIIAAALGLSLLLPFHIHLEEVTEFLNNTIGKMTRVVVKG